MTHEVTNIDRALWAKEALAVFTRRTFGGVLPDAMEREDVCCAVSDLICDLLHLAKQLGFDATAVISQACGHFGAELLEEVL